VPTEPPYSLWHPGGMMGIDSSNNLYLTTTDKNLVSRYSLPYQKSASGTNVCLPLAKDYLFGSPVLWLGVTNHDAGPAHIYYNDIGTYAYKGQLFVHDLLRYMVWNDYLDKDSGADADVFVGQTSTGLASMIFLWEAARALPQLIRRNAEEKLKAIVDK
jgi:hypothetical protein